MLPRCRHLVVRPKHGVGRCKRGLLHLSRSPATLAAMAQVKAIFDPRGILNPGKLLPDFL